MEEEIVSLNAARLYFEGDGGTIQSVFQVSPNYSS